MKELLYLVYDDKFFIAAFRLMEDVEIFIAKRKKELPGYHPYRVVDLKKGEVITC